MCPKEEAIKTLQEDGIVADTRISIDLVKEYFYKPDGEISNAEAMEILKKSIEHPYFLSGFIEIMGHITETNFNNIKPK
jgi:hypothetical protein